MTYSLTRFSSCLLAIFEVLDANTVIVAGMIQFLCAERPEVRDGFLFPTHAKSDYCTYSEVNTYTAKLIYKGRVCSRCSAFNIFSVDVLNFCRITYLCSDCLETVRSPNTVVAIKTLQIIPFKFTLKKSLTILGFHFVGILLCVGSSLAA